MKTISKFIIPIFAIAFIACQNDVKFQETGSNGVVIADGVIKSPEWLIHVVDSVGHRYKPSPVTGTYAYPWVYSVKHKGQEYIYVADGLNSYWPCGALFFTLSGEPVGGFPGDPTESLFNDLAAESNRTLLWRDETFL